MLDVLRAHTASFPLHQQRNALREYLQWLILQALDDAGYRRNLAFTGGTCLRVVYGTGRFSEDLDFSLVAREGYGIHAMKEHLLRRLRHLGLEPESSPVKTGKAMESLFLRFGGLLHPLKLSAIKAEKLSVKVEVDTRPPAGGVVEEFLFQDPLLFVVNHYDLPSLFATKIHAFLFRGYDKGRDYYDVLHFLRKKVTPSLALLQAAVRQTHPELAFPTLASVIQAVRAKLKAMDEAQVLRDVRPFLLHPGEERYLRKELLLKSLEQAYPVESSG